MRGSGRIRKPTTTARCPPKPGPWLVLSSGGADGAFGAGLLTGLSAAGKRPDYRGRHRRHDRRADGAVYLCRAALRRSAAQGLHQGHRRRHFRGRRLDRRELRRFVAAQGSDRQANHAGSCWPISPPRIAPAGGCSSSPPISTPNARWSGTWAPSPRMAASRRPNCSAPCCSRPPRSGRFPAGADRRRSERQAICGNARGRRRRRPVLRRAGGADGGDQ